MAKDIALFAWEGFRFRHPEDWAPIVLSGNRKEGYVRLQGSGRIGCQVRWKRSKSDPDLPAALAQYFQLLHRDAKKGRSQIQTESTMQGDDMLGYRWLGSGQGRGALLASPGGGVFFIEVIGGRADSLLTASRSLLESFESNSESAFDHWSLFGLEVRLPAGLSPSEKLLQSGRTWLTFRPRGATIEVGRYAFGLELVRRHGLEAWARAALRMPKSVATLNGDSCIRLALPSRRLRPSATALVRLDEAKNQLVCIRCATNGPKWVPQWEWMA